MKCRVLAVILGLTALLLLASAMARVSASPGTLYVEVGGVDSGDCAGTPCASIGYALSQASSGETIKVAEGTYTENISIDTNVTLEGGYESASWNRDIHAYETTVDGSCSQTVASFQSGSDGAVLDGFTITGGCAPEHGGGIYIEQASPTISNCTITANSAASGAGLAIYDGAAPLIVNNDIISNTAECCGGGLRVIAGGGTIQNNRIISNTAVGWAGGGMEIAVEAWTTVVSNSIVGNVAGTGGGIAVNWYCTVTVSSNEIVSNRTTEGAGGGVWVADFSSAVVDRNRIATNTADSGGGMAIFNGSTVTATNNVIASNMGLSEWQGDGIVVLAGDNASDARIINNTIASNSAEAIQANQGTVLARNNIILGNNGGIHDYLSGATVSSDHNAFWDNGWDYLNVSPGPGDMSADPLLVDVSGGDYHLSPNSPVIDRGTSTAAPSTDFDGQARPFDGDRDGAATVDIGADEVHVRWAYLPMVLKSYSSPTLIWSANVRVNDDTGTGRQFDPAIAVDASGNAYAVWHDGRYYTSSFGDIFFSFRPVGGDWAPNVKVNDDTSGRHHSPAIEVDGPGNAYAVWEGTPTFWPHDIYFDYRSAEANWGADAKVNDNPKDADHGEPAIAVDSTGSAYLLWVDYRNDPDGACNETCYTDIYFSHRPAAGSWGPNVKVNDDAGTGSQWWPSIALDSAGNAFAVWVDGRGGNDDIYFSYRPAGGIWGANIKVNDDVGSARQYRPVIAVESSGDAYAIWWDNRSGNDDIYFSYRPIGGDWGPNVRVNDDTGGANQKWPSVSVDGSTGNACAVWVDQRWGHNDIYSAYRPANGDWSPNVKVNDTDGTAFTWVLDTALGANGRVYAIWQDARNGNDDIYFAYGVYR
ncbi:MAG TPA: right-handed parallel beta-helix repeat-containing protein [Anaerolineae bacterium]|nr:right-handed parallel beta-helix repeat-containing protein [Anaerolineae bacterium]